MTKFEDFKILVKAMKSAYTAPNFLPDAEAVKVWYQLLKDIPYELLSNVVQSHIMSCKFPPTIAEIRQKAAEITYPENYQDWSIAWQETCGAIASYGSWRSKDGMESLSPLTRECVKRLGWMNLCASENPAADRANFRTIYEQLQTAHKKTAVLSPTFIGKTERLKLGGTDEPGYIDRQTDKKY